MQRVICWLVLLFCVFCSGLSALVDWYEGHYDPYHLYASSSHAMPLEADTEPPSMFDLRPVDVVGMAALGDSVTAAFASKGGRPINPFDWRVYPGTSYAMGGDANITSLIRLLGAANASAPLTGGGDSEGPLGASRGDGLVKICLGRFCPPQRWLYSPARDGWNGAISGAQSVHLWSQWKYVSKQVGQAQKKGALKRPGWLLWNLFIGANDACNHCDVIPGRNASTESGNDADIDTSLLSFYLIDEGGESVPISYEMPAELRREKQGTPRFYEIQLRTVLEAIRAEFPYSLVQLNHLFNVSQLTAFRDAYGAGYCGREANILQASLCPCLAREEEERRAGKRRPGESDIDARVGAYNDVLDRILADYMVPIEALLRPDAVSQVRDVDLPHLRKLMAEKGAQWRVPRHSRFAVLPMPVSRDVQFIRDRFPITFLSPFDCFHPSVEAHGQMALAILHAMLVPFAARPRSFVVPVPPYHPSPTDRLMVY